MRSPSPGARRSTRRRCLSTRNCGTNHLSLSISLFLPETSPARLLIDSSSLPLISGSTIDYATELIGSSFRVQGNPHASDKGGCGCGVSE